MNLSNVAIHDELTTLRCRGVMNDVAIQVEQSDQGCTANQRCEYGAGMYPRKSVL